MQVTTQIVASPCRRPESEFGAGYAKRLTHWRNIVADTCRTFTYSLYDQFAGKVDPYLEKS